MKYTHPDKYKGEWLSHETTCLWVEDRCIKCDKFMGKDHDFYECKQYRTKPQCSGMRIVFTVPDSYKRFKELS